MITRKYLTEATPSEKDEMRKLYREHSVIKEQFDFSWEGIKNVVPYWADKLGYDSDDIDVSVEGISNIPSWWSDKINDLTKEKIVERPNDDNIWDVIYKTVKQQGEKLPSYEEFIKTGKKIFMPWS